MNLKILLLTAIVSLTSISSFASGKISFNGYISNPTCSINLIDCQHHTIVRETIKTTLSNQSYKELIITYL